MIIGYGGLLQNAQFSSAAQQFENDWKKEWVNNEGRTIRELIEHIEHAVRSNNEIGCLNDLTERSWFYTAYL